MRYVQNEQPSNSRNETETKKRKGETHFPNCFPLNALSFCVHGLMMLSLGEMYLFAALIVHPIVSIPVFITFPLLLPLSLPFAFSSFSRLQRKGVRRVARTIHPPASPSAPAGDTPCSWPSLFRPGSHPSLARRLSWRLGRWMRKAFAGICWRWLRIGRCVGGRWTLLFEVRLWAARWKRVFGTGIFNKSL